ncbi:MAG: hypothetical protein K2Q14_06625 [Gammaproteobacteria bacterium]|nr:hypothetical protein [Gammaproteobacteria bacterium]
MSAIIKAVFNYFLKKWYSLMGLCCLTGVTFLIYLKEFYKYINSTNYEYFLIALFFIFLIEYIGWFYSIKPPKKKKNKIGIAIGIYSDTKKTDKRIKQDFIRCLKKEISSITSNNEILHELFHVFEIQEFHSKKIIENPDDASFPIKYLQLTRANLFLTGNCKIRKSNGKDRYFLELDARVVHMPVPVVTRQSLSKEMSNVLPNKIDFPVEQENEGFSFATNIARDGLLYIIGMACIVSNDGFTAYQIFHELWNVLKNNRLRPSKLLIDKLETSALFMASQIYQKKPLDLDELNKYLLVLQSISPNSCHAHLLRGIYYFHKEQMRLALIEINKALRKNEPGPHLSRAFIYAYSGKNLDKVYQEYEKALKYSMDKDIGNIILDVEIFIQNVIDKEPDKVELWYCLGIINLKFKDDKELMKENFNKFIGFPDNIKKYPKQVAYSKKCIQEISIVQ